MRSSDTKRAHTFIVPICLVLVVTDQLIAVTRDCKMTVSKRTEWNKPTTEWHTVDRTEHSYVLATLVSHLEKGFQISPSSQPLDGKLRLLHFGPMNGDEVMKIMTGAYQGGKHTEDPRVGYETIDGLRVEFDEQDARWRRICVDGKIVRVEQGGWVEVRSGAGKSVVDLIAL